MSEPVLLSCNPCLYDPEDWADDPGERIAKLLTKYAERERQELDARPWWVKVRDTAKWDS